jgi:hypothetical protein
LQRITDYPALLNEAWAQAHAPREANAPTVISTFAGCGGSSLGYHMAGFRELLAVEWEQNAADTFRLNFPHVPLYHGDIAKLSVAECLRLANIAPGELDVFDGSPPCFPAGTVWGVYSSPILERDIGAGALLLATGPNTNGSTSLRVGIRNSTFSTLTGAGNSSIVLGSNNRPRLATGSDGRDVVTLWEVGGEAGPQVLDYGTLTARRLGIPRGMGLDRQNTTLSGATGFLSAASACRYAVLFVLGDPSVNGAQFGSPGMTSVVTNSTGASADVATRVLLPKVYGTASTNLPADTYWVQVYRSVVQATSAGEPPSELALVYQKIISAADIAAACWRALHRSRR